MSGPGTQKVAVIGGGVAGLSTSLALAGLRYRVLLMEREPTLGGRVSKLACLAPDLRPASEAVEGLIEQVRREPLVRVVSSADPQPLRASDGSLSVMVEGGRVAVPALVLATGLEGVPTAPIPEYGHGSHRSIVTSEELEAWSGIGGTNALDDVHSVVFIQCVGSRTERRGVPYCSAICCSNSVKNALRLKREDPSREIVVLYIDMRTAGPGEEIMYREARRSGIRFIRGQPSLVLRKGEQLVVCGENTLLRELYEIPADLVVLANGQRQSPTNLYMMDQLGIFQGTNGFPLSEGSRTNVEGVFVVGSARRVMDLPTARQDARACALDVHEYLKGRSLAR